MEIFTVITVLKKGQNAMVMYNLLLGKGGAIRLAGVFDTVPEVCAVAWRTGHGAGG